MNLATQENRKDCNACFLTDHRSAPPIYRIGVGTPNSPSTILKGFKELLTIASSARVRLHHLRHSAAYIMLLPGVRALVV